MDRIQHKPIPPHICRRLAATLFAFAAVPMEAYDEGAVTDESSYNMANPDWHDYTNRLWASRWHEAWKRIDPNDGRCGMTWRGITPTTTIRQAKMS